MRAKLTDWERVLKQMVLCNKTAGYIDFIKDRLQFFECDPKFKNTVACYISREKIFQYMKSHHHNELQGGILQ